MSVHIPKTRSLYSQHQRASVDVSGTRTATRSGSVAESFRSLASMPPPRTSQARRVSAQTSPPGTVGASGKAPVTNGREVRYWVDLHEGDDLGFGADYVPGEGIIFTELRETGALARCGVAPGQLVSVDGIPIRSAKDMQDVFLYLHKHRVLSYAVVVQPTDPAEIERVESLTTALRPQPTPAVAVRSAEEDAMRAMQQQHQQQQQQLQQLQQQQQELERQQQLHDLVQQQHAAQEAAAAYEEQAAADSDFAQARQAALEKRAQMAEVLNNLQGQVDMMTNVLQNMSFEASEADSEDTPTPHEGEYMQNASLLMQGQGQGQGGTVSSVVKLDSTHMFPAAAAVAAADLPTEPRADAPEPYILPPGKYLGPFPSGAPVTIEDCDGFRKMTIYTPAPESRERVQVVQDAAAGGVPNGDAAMSPQGAPGSAMRTASASTVIKTPMPLEAVTPPPPPHMPQNPDAFGNFLETKPEAVVPQGVLAGQYMREKALLALIRHASPPVASVRSPTAFGSEQLSPAAVGGYNTRSPTPAMPTATEPPRQSLPGFTVTRYDSSPGNVSAWPSAQGGGPSDKLASLVKRAQQNTARTLAQQQHH